MLTSLRVSIVIALLAMATVSMGQTGDKTVLVRSFGGVVQNSLELISGQAVASKFENAFGKANSSFKVRSLSTTEPSLSTPLPSSRGLEEIKKERVEYYCYVSFVNGTSGSEFVPEAKVLGVTIPAHVQYNSTSTVEVKIVEVETARAETRSYSCTGTSDESQQVATSNSYDEICDLFRRDLVNGIRFAVAKRFDSVPIVGKGPGYIRIGYGRKDGLSGDVEFEVVVSRTVGGFKEEEVYGTAKLKKDGLFEDNAKLEVKRNGRVKRGEDVYEAIPDEWTFLRIKSVSRERGLFNDGGDPWLIFTKK